MKILFILSFLISNIVSASVNSDIEIRSRSIPDMCRFIYRIETDFNIKVKKAKNADLRLRYMFKDIYSGEIQSSKEIALNNESDDFAVAEFVEETMSTQRHYLYHEMIFDLYDNEGLLGSFKTNFSSNMNKCYPGGRSQAPFLKLNVVRTY